MKKISKIALIAGGAGFIGSNLTKELLSEEFIVVVADNFSRGKKSNLENCQINLDKVKIFDSDLSLEYETIELFKKCQQFGQITEVWHLAANSDIYAGVQDSHIDLKDTFLTTHSLLKAMQECNVDTLHFASSSAIYGDLGDIELHEAIGPLLPISNYGAMKLASEALISAASETFLKKTNIFRFPNVVGTPATHGVILDFVSKLSTDPKKLEVLGDGNQKKSYLHVSDLIKAMLVARNKVRVNTLDVVNIGPVDDGVTVKWIAEQVVARTTGGKSSITYGSSDRGWVGDVPKFRYSTKKIQSYGWTPHLGSKDAVLKAIDEILLEINQDISPN